MRVAFFNRFYDPDPEATGQYLTELAEDLVARGERVSVVCGRANRMRGKWHLMPIEVKTRKGVRVIRVFNTHLPKSVFLFRLVNLGTYFAGCVLAFFLLAPPNLVVSLTDPPLLPLLAGAYARLMGARFVFAINDLYPDVAIELRELSNPVWLKLLDLATSFGLRHADLVTVLGNDMKKKVVSKGCPPGKIAVTPYWVDTDRIRPSKKHNRFRRRCGFRPCDFIVMYSGNLGLSQRLENVLLVARELREYGDLTFVIVGEGANKASLQTRARQLGLDGHVVFLPYEPKDGLAQSLSAADLHLIPLAPGVAGSIVPSKMYGIMASGTPYLAIMDRESDVVRIAERCKCGFWCPPNAPAELRKSIEYAYENRGELEAMGSNGRQAAEEEFSRTVGTGRYHALFASVASRGGSRK